jgi:hypothetical protein
MNINKIISIMERRGFLRWVPTEVYLKLRYQRLMGYKLDLENPKLYTEKLQALKLKYANSSNLPQYTVMADKVKAKEYVGRILGEEFIIPTLGIWDGYEQINFDTLPDKFVLKTNHDSGGVVVCSDKAKFDKKKARIKLTKSLKRNFYWFGREPQYRDIKPQIFAEQYMQNSDQGLHDYKVWCFNGKALYAQYKTPSNAILFVMLVSAIAPFFGRTALNWIVDMSSIGAAIGYAYTSAAAMKFAWQEKRWTIVCTGAFGTVMGILFAALLLIPIPMLNCSLSKESYICLIVWVLMGIVFYFQKRKS